MRVKHTFCIKKKPEKQISHVSICLCDTVFLFIMSISHHLYQLLFNETLSRLWSRGQCQLGKKPHVQEFTWLRMKIYEQGATDYTFSLRDYLQSIPVPTYDRKDKYFAHSSYTL
jgi:hypothetical protein